MGKWEMVRLGDVFKIASGGTPVKNRLDYYNKGTIPWVKTGDLKEKYVNSKYVERITDLGLANSSAKLFPSDTVLIAMYGATIGATSILNFEACTNQACAAFLPSQSIQCEFLYYFLLSQKANFIKLGVGGAQPNISATILKEVKIPLPPLDEQKRIAKNLDLASEIVKGYKKQLAELDKLVQSVFYEIFGDPVTNEKGWDCKPLSKTTQIVTGNTPPRNCKDNYGHCIEWIKTDNITDALYVTQASEYLSERGAEIGRLVDADAILMACIAGSIKSIGRVAIANRKVAFNQQINAVIANEYDTLFLYWLFRMTQRYIQSTINMSLKGILSKGKLEKLVFIAPPLPLQAHFSSIATEIEAQKVQIRQALTEAENLLNSLMQKYFE